MLLMYWAVIMNDDLSISISVIRKVTPQEAEAIWSEYFPRLLRFAQKKLMNMPRRTFDEEDVALSAMHSFFKGQEAGRFNDLSGNDEIWRLLVTITARKVTAQRRKHLADKRGGGSVRGESVFAKVGHDDGIQDGLAQLMDENRMPESVEDVIGTCDELLLALKDDKLQQTAVMRMEGYTNKEISEQLGCSVARTKQRVARIKEIWGKTPSYN